MTEMQMLLCEAQFSANIEHRLWQEVDDLRAQGLDVAETWEQLGEQIERIAKRKQAIIGDLREYLDSGWLKIPVQVESAASAKQKECR